QNASTWTESPFEDLMFRLNRAVWNASAAVPLSAALIARGVAPDANTIVDSYQFYPHDVQFADKTRVTYQFDIKPMNPATEDLTGQVAVRYTVHPNQWSLLSTRSMIQGYGGRNGALNTENRPLPNFDSPL